MSDALVCPRCGYEAHEGACQREALRGTVVSELHQPAPDMSTRPDGQHPDHWILSAEERAKGFIRPVRQSYVHVGPDAPQHPLRDLTDEEKQRFDGTVYVKFEVYPPNPESSVIGRFWTEAQLQAVQNPCGAVTHMPLAIAETYARDPRFYGSTFCCRCRGYFPVGAHGEFVWNDDSGEKVGT